MANRLAQETSPYLLQHRDNPVDWYPWGEEALARAREQDRPILLSVGYSACHWCHVMERESFEDAETAAYMNEHFVNVKVDREERPDVDAIYMEAVQAMSGHGGWPMTVFLDPDGVPFYGGTYFPPDESRGMPSFRMVMEAVVDAFESNREELRERAPETRARLGAIGAIEPAPRRPARSCWRRRWRRCWRRADREHGGFGGAPKFPPASALELLLARGEHRAWSSAPSTRCWPAASTTSSAAASPATRSTPSGSSPTSRRCSTTTPCWPAPTCTAGRRSATSATAASARRRWTGCCARCAAPRAASTRPSTPTPRARRAASTSGRRRRSARCSATMPRPSIDFYGVSERGNFEGAQHPPPRRRRRGRSEPRGSTRRARALYEARAERVWPGLDDKRLDRLERAGDRRPGRGRRRARPRGLPGRRPRLRRVRARPTCATRDGRLLRTYKDGDARLNAYLEDHAFLLEALLTLYEASFEPRWFEAARALAETTIARFGDPERGGFFSTSADHEELIARRKEIGDHPIPSGNSAAALGLLRLAALSGEREYECQAEGVLRLFAKRRRAPRGLRPPAARPRLPPRPEQGGGPDRRGPR